MTPAEQARALQVAVSQIQYKPGWRFLCAAPPDCPAYLQVVCVQPDVDKVKPTRYPQPVAAQQYIHLHASVPLSWEDIDLYVRQPRLLLDRIWDLVYEIEEHEMREWLKYGDEHVRTPHEADGGFSHS